MNTRGAQLYGVGADVEVKRIILQIQMQLQKRDMKKHGLVLKHLLTECATQDKDNQGALDFDGFELALKKQNIFRPVVELQALMKYYNVSSRSDVKDSLIDYTAFVQGLRIPLTGRRLEIIQDVWVRIAGDLSAETTTHDKAKEAFKFEDFSWFSAAVGMAEGDGQASFTKQAFMDLQADFAMTIFDDDQFVGLVNSAWDVTEPAYKTVTQKDLETVMQAIRASLLKAGTEKHTEEFVLREVFREFDRNSNGSLSKIELGLLLNKINLSVDDKYLEALIKKLDMNGNGAVEFEEFVHFIVQDQYHRV